MSGSKKKSKKIIRFIINDLACVLKIMLLLFSAYGRDFVRFALIGKGNYINMADEITIKLYMDNSLVSPSEQINTGTLRYDMHGDAMVRGVQNIGTSEEQINVGDIASLGFCYFKNLEPPDAGNYVEVGTSTGVYQIKLRAGQVGLMPLNGTAVYAKANTAAVNLQYFLTEDLS